MFLNPSHTYPPNPHSVHEVDDRTSKREIQSDVDQAYRHGQEAEAQNRVSTAGTEALAETIQTCEYRLTWLATAGLYTDESPGLKVDPVVVLVLSLVFIFSVVALHSEF